VSGSRKLAVLAAAVPALLIALPGALAAQDAGLSKSQLVQVVVSSDPPAAKLATVRENCLSFEPTDRDWRDLRNLGASEELIEAAQDCARRAQAVRIGLSASRATATAGDTTLLTVDLSRGGTPVAGQPVTLVGSGGPGNGARYSRTTNAGGRAFFSVAAGEAAGATRYTVSVAGLEVEGPTRITVTTVAAQPAVAEVDPASVEVAEGDSVPEFAITVADRFGNPVPEADVVLTGGTGEDPPVLASGVTDADGTIRVSVANPPAAEMQTWQVRADGAVLVSVPVRITPRVAEEAGPPAMPPPPVESADDRAVAAGYASLEAGDPQAAEQSFRQALGITPRRADAQMGLGEALLAQGRADEAVTWFEFATRQSPGNANAWDGLGRAYVAEGRRQDASRAFERAREIDPSREDLQTEIADLSRPPGYLSASLWGGSTSGNLDSGGIRRAAFDLSLSPVISLRGGWDRSLAPYSPELVRGYDEWDGWYAGGSVGYGSEQRFRTAIDIGQREQSFSPIDDSTSITQNLYRLTQTFRFGEDRRSTKLDVGGYLGRWYDEDDWIVFARFKAPVSRQLSVVASGNYGQTIGTNWVETGRHADKDGRVYAGVAWETAKGFLLQPVVGVGSVSSDRSEALSGTLFDLILEANVPIFRGAGIRGYLRHQNPPGSDAFTTFAIGLAYRLGWAGG
jgi:tetratricopeptide (TPR) repeat protein